MNFDEWYRQSPTRLCGPTAEDIERGRKLREAYAKGSRPPLNTESKRHVRMAAQCEAGDGAMDE